MDRSNIYRLVKADRPPKMPVELILALCKILKCTFEDLVVEIEPDAAPRNPPREGPGPWSRTCRCCPATSSTPKADEPP